MRGRVALGHRRVTLAPGRVALAVGCAVLAACAAAQPPAQEPAPSPTVGTARGALFIAGGGALHSDLVARFVELAGGADARIVVVPTAASEDSFPGDWSGLRMFRNAGVQHVSLLHTRSRDTADSEQFAAPLRTATGVWLSGGRQWRLADAYLDTQTLSEIRALLDRGGVVGGTSAGASIQASYMVRGAVESNTIMMAPGHEAGFGLLRNTAIDQHLTARGRQDDMLQVVRQHPALLGIGIDEGTALIVKGDRAEITGRGRVAFYNTTDRSDQPYYFLSPGDTFDLAARRIVTGTPIPPQVAQQEAEVIAAMNRLFDAMRNRDTAAVRQLIHPGVSLFVPTADNGTHAIRVTTLDAWIPSLARAVERLDERAIRPEVRIDGPLASVWTRYEFRVGSTFSHCGTDAFQFGRTAAGWSIIALAFTLQREGCAP